MSMKMRPILPIALPGAYKKPRRIQIAGAEMKNNFALLFYKANRF